MMRFKTYHKTHPKALMEILTMHEVCDSGSDDVDDFYWLMSTGLTDINGVEIFEGDIVQDTVYKDFDVIETVIFDKDNARFRTDGAIDWKINSEHCKVLKVVGNIHTTPELLKDEK